MIDQIWNLLSQNLQNQFLSGGIILMLTGSVIALCRRLPLQLWEWFQRRFTISIDVSNDDPLFGWLALWLAEQPYSRRARSLTATSERDEYGRSGPTLAVNPGSAEAQTLPQILLTPAPGNHILLYKRRLIWLSRDRKETPPSKDDSFASFWKREVFTVRMIGRKQDTARALLEDARMIAANRRQKKVEIYIAGYDYWQSVDERDTRPLSTIFLPDGTAESVVADVRQFLDSKTWYTNRGIPYRRGYLFHGTPGSGKTSLICALAGHFRMNLYILNIASCNASDDNVMSLLSRVPARSIVLLEDIDSAFSQRQKSEDVRNRLTFSGLLNALDGAASKEGTLVFMTTNHPDRLDEALVRPGRADVHVSFTFATADQGQRIYHAFYPEASIEMAWEFGETCVHRRVTMAEIQQTLLGHRDSAEGALQAFQVFDTAAA